jgi:hypothetical protein
MKFASLPVVAIFILIATLQMSVTSCKKDTVTVTDTLYVPVGDTAFSFALLTGTPWKIQEIRGVTGNNPYYYLRGSVSSTQSFDNEYIVFNTDKTGTYYDNGGTGTPITWDFEDSTFTKLHYSVPFPSGTVVAHWEHIVYRKGGIRYGEYFINGADYSHSEGIRIPKNSGAVNLKLAN